MKIGNIFEELIGDGFLNEASVTDIKNKYYSDIADDVFKEIVSSDPRTKVNNGEVVKVGKYSKLLLDMYRKGNLKMEDLPKATEYLEIVYKRQIPLTALDSLSDLYDIVKPYMLADSETDLSILIDYLDESQYELLMDGEEWFIFKPKDEKAACVLGSGTEWCTTWGSNSTNPKHKDRESHYPYYSKQDTLYIIINKADNSNKYQFHIKGKQFMDKADRQININEFFKGKEEVFYFFNPEFRDLSSYSSDDLMSIITRQLLPRDRKDELLEVIVSKNSNNDIVKLFNASYENDDFNEINKILGSDFQIEDISGSVIEFKELKDDDLDVYDRLGGDYQDYNNWVDDEEVERVIEDSWDEVVKGVKEAMILQYKMEGIDLMSYLKHNNVSFDGGYLEHLLRNYGNYSNFEEDVKYVISEAEDRAERQAENELSDSVSGLFSIRSNEIEKDLFLIYLMTTNDYDMDSFKDFLEKKFDVIVDRDSIYESINEKKYQYIDIDVKDMVKLYNDRLEKLCEADIDSNWEDYRNYELKTNPESSEYYQNTHGEDISKDFERLKDRIYGILKKYTNKHNLFLSDGFRVLRIFSNKINPSTESVYITFEDLVGSNDYEGYIKIDDLPRYINYNENAASFYENLWRIMGGLGLDTNKTEFENELVKLKINYGKVDVDNNKIYIELMNKGNGNVDKGMVNINSLPTHYTNHKLFEEINRIKKLL
jgi:hypothetical protein